MSSRYQCECDLRPCPCVLAYLKGKIQNLRSVRGTQYESTDTFNYLNRAVGEHNAYGKACGHPELKENRP